MLLRPIFCSIAVMGLCLATACDGSKSDDTCTQTPAIATLFPADGEIGSWAIEAGSTFETGTTRDELVPIIDGAADPFVDNGFLAWGRQHYSDTTNSIDYQLYQMPSVAKNQETWDALVDPTKNYRQSMVTGGWTAIDGLGDAARVASGSTSSWWFGVRKCAYQVDAHVTDKATGTKSEATKTAGVTFLTAAVAKVPN